MIKIAIDGACKGNGRADCESGSGIFAVIENEDGLIEYKTRTASEENSTNQRGELRALLMALRLVEQESNGNDEVHIIMDSEYLFNIMTKEWYKGWRSRKWITASGTPVKNQDIIKDIVALYETLSNEIMFYHIKGHVIPDGGATAMLYLEADPLRLLKYYEEKFETYLLAKDSRIAHAMEVTKTINGFDLPDNTLKEFVAMNCVADRVAVSALQ